MFWTLILNWYQIFTISQSVAIVILLFSYALKESVISSKKIPQDIFNKFTQFAIFPKKTFFAIVLRNWRSEPGWSGLLQRRYRRVDRQRNRTSGHPLPLGPAPGSSGEGRLGQPWHCKLVRNLFCRLLSGIWKQGN